jgi:hypothetical protein
VERTPITQRLPPDGDGLAAHDSTVDTVSHTGVAGRHGALAEPSRETLRKYNRWLRVYHAWCAEQSYQVELANLTDAKAEEFIGSLVVQRGDRPRYSPNAVGQALSAMRYWARRAAVHPMPSFDAAYGVLHTYLDHLAATDVIESRQRRRIRPGDPVG